MDHIPILIQTKLMSRLRLPRRQSHSRSTQRPNGCRTPLHSPPCTLTHVSARLCRYVSSDIQTRFSFENCIQYCKPAPRTAPRRRPRTVPRTVPRGSLRPCSPQEPPQGSHKVPAGVFPAFCHVANLTNYRPGKNMEKNSGGPKETLQTQANE